MGKLTGKIKWYNSKKGFGVIEDSAGATYFVHSSDFDQEDFEEFGINKDLKVEFIIDKDHEFNSLPRVKNVVLDA